jgi:hypothetical protein
LSENFSCTLAFYFLIMSCKEEILASIYVGRTFEDFDEVQKLYDDLTNKCYFPVKYKERRSVASHNKMVAMQYLYICVEW